MSMLFIEMMNVLWTLSSFSRQSVSGGCSPSPDFFHRIWTCQRERLTLVLCRITSLTTAYRFIFKIFYLYEVIIMLQNYKSDPLNLYACYCNRGKCLPIGSNQQHAVRERNSHSPVPSSLHCNLSGTECGEQRVDYIVVPQKLHIVQVTHILFDIDMELIGLTRSQCATETCQKVSMSCLVCDYFSLYMQSL